MVTVQDVIDLSHQMLWTAFLLSMPVLMTALVVGVLISLVQTVTGVQEMTITFVPKLIMVLVVMAVAMPWMITVITEFTHEAWANLGGLP